MRDDTGVMMLINCLIKNTNKEGQSGGDPFWEKSETALLQALIFYLIKYCPPSEQNFASIMKLLDEAEVNENNPNAKSSLDIRFEALEKIDPDSIALKQYKIFKRGAGKTLKSILISVSVRLSHFNIPQVANLTSTDDLDLKTLGDEKQALFVIIPAADDTYNYLVSMMYYQLFETLYYHAENECEGKRLPYHVRFILDEFANIGQIPQFPQKLSTMRKYEISCTIILQSIAQIKAMYEKEYETLMGNCDSTIFLGSPEQSNLEYISKLLGDATIVVRNSSRNEGAKSGGSSLSYNRDQRNLMTTNELYNMDDQHCVILISGIRPFYDFKYPLEMHPNFKLSADGNKSLLFNYREAEEFNFTSKLQKSYQKPMDINAKEIIELMNENKKTSEKAKRIEEVFQEIAAETGDKELEDNLYNDCVTAEDISKYITFGSANDKPDELSDDDVIMMDQFN
jgi:type IV secretion system protein VirD4